MQNVCFSGEELTNNINGDESTMRNGEKKEKTDSDICMSNIQEHRKVQNFRKRQNFLKATCIQGLYSYTCIGKSWHDQAQQCTLLQGISKLSDLLLVFFSFTKL